MIFKYLLLAFLGLSFGALASSGVFTVLVAVGLVPRFAGKTHTSRYVLVYEEMVVFGTIAGCLISTFPEYLQIGQYLRETMPRAASVWDVLGNVALLIGGVSCGMFVGCLALAIAEMLDSIPIFARRVSLRHGTGIVILSIAIGKLMGALIYFLLELHRTSG